MTLPSPRDWPEDRAHENGNYLCFCLTCKEHFIGHKRRATCRICYERDYAEAKRRGQWLHEHDAPKDWVVHTMAEVQQVHAEYADLLLQLNVERNLRRDLVASTERMIEEIRLRGPLQMGNHAVRDAHIPLDKAKRLDAELAERQAAERTPAPTTTSTPSP